MQSTKEFRQKVRTGEWNSQTSGVEYDIVQTNVVILPKEYAFDFLLFCQRNPKSCPTASGCGGTCCCHFSVVPKP